VSGHIGRSEIGASSPGIRDAGALKGKVDNARNDTRAREGPEGRLRPQEHPIIVSGRSAVLQVIKQGVTGVLWQRQPDLPSAFAAHAEHTFLPRDIVQAHGEDITGPQAETGQEE
jgi:hypothetical protein